jgi:DNA-binding GntR family transcriptional regulator
MTRQARHGSLRSEAYRRLREDILLGRYKRGEALTEQQVSLEMGVSRTPIREAFGQLELEGLVRSTPNKGVVVQGFDENDIHDLYDVRGQMEALAAARAARQMDEAQRQALKEAYERECRCTEGNEDIDLLQNLDSAFHDLIFKGTGSKILEKILSPINIYTRHARSISLATPGRSRQVVEEHGRILEAILNQDCEAARLRMSEHIERASASFLTVSMSRRQKSDG